MKMTGITGADLRLALRAVREQLGPDAVVLSTRGMLNGVEITAAVDFDAEAGLAGHDSPPAHAALATTDAAPVAARDFEATANAAHEAAAARAENDMSSELKALRRILETQLAHLAWNDLSRRSPIQAELLRELTEMGLSQEIAAKVVAQLPPCNELTYARRLAIATLSQYLCVTGDRWLDSGGR